MIHNYQEFMRPFLEIAKDTNGKEVKLRDVINQLAQRFNLSEEDREERLPSGKQTILDNRIGWARTYLTKAGLLEATKRAHFIITDRGIQALQDKDALINDQYLKLDTVTYSGYSSQAADDAEKMIQTFKDFIEQHKDEIHALSFFYQQPYQRRGLTFAMLEELHQALNKPPLLLTTEKLWTAYERLNQGDSSNKKKTDTKRQLTDIISLIRFAIGLDAELKPFAEQVDAKFKKWIFRHNAQRSTAFSEQQTQWLRLIKDHISASCFIERDDFDYNPFSDHGGLQKAWDLFSVSNENNDNRNELDSLLAEMNQELIA